MMILVGQMKRLSKSGGAMVACLIAVALLAGPLCAPACSGMACFSGSARATESGNCHAITGDARTHLKLGPAASACGFRDAAPAVLNRPVADEFTWAAHSGGFSLATASASGQQVVDACSILRGSSSGPPLASQCVVASALILRI